MSLKQELAKRLLNDMILKARGHDPAVVLVVDLHTSKILSSCLRMYDIMEAGVIVLQNVTLDRERLDLPAIYFVDPVKEVVQKIISDFTPDPKTKKTRYTHAHLFFTSRVPKSVMTLIAESSIIKKIKSFVELNVDWVAFESRVFHFDRPGSIPRLYFADSTEALTSELTIISQHLVSLCLTLKEYPYVRYAAVGKSGICHGLATFFEAEMKKTVSKLTDWKFNENRGTLLIVDRSMDAVAPLMHEYTFQAMINDLLKVGGEICFLPNQEKTEKKSAGDEKESNTDELVLSEDDPLWLEFRHEHIGSVMHDVTKKFREFKGANKMAQLQQDENSTVKDMIQAMKDMPEYKNMMKKYHKHMSIAQECMSKFDSRHLKELGELEQDMATGLTNDGKSASQKTLKQDLVRMCQDPSIGVLDKLRLLMIFIISQGAMQDTTRRELMKNVHVDLQNAIRNLDKLGVELSTFNKKAKHSKERLAEFEKRNRDIPLALMRYLPGLHTTMEALVAGELPEDKFPYTSPPPPGSRPSAASARREGRSARRRGNTENKSNNDWKSQESEEDNRPRFIVFMMGGLTFSEMRTLYEIAENTKANIYIGSTSTITATEYIQDLSNLDHGQFKSAVKASAQVGGAGAGAGASSGGAGRRQQYEDSDSDDDEPRDFNKLSIKVSDR